MNESRFYIREDRLISAGLLGTVASAFKCFGDPARLLLFGPKGV